MKCWLKSVSPSQQEAMLKGMHCPLVCNVERLRGEYEVWVLLLSVLCFSGMPLQVIYACSILVQRAGQRQWNRFDTAEHLRLAEFWCVLAWWWPMWSRRSEPKRGLWRLTLLRGHLFLPSIGPLATSVLVFWGCSCAPCSPREGLVLNIV